MAQKNLNLVFQMGTGTLSPFSIPKLNDATESSFRKFRFSGSFFGRFYQRS